MAIDLGELIPNLVGEVNPPGGNMFPNATDDDWLVRLQNAFWETVLDGIVSGYTESDGEVTPDSGTTEFPRDLQQLVIFYAGISIIRNKMHDVKAKFRAKAGPVEYETEQAATILKAVMDELVRRRNIILNRLADLGRADSFYIDMVLERSDSLIYGDSIWVNY